MDDLPLTFMESQVNSSFISYLSSFIIEMCDKDINNFTTDEPASPWDDGPLSLWWPLPLLRTYAIGLYLSFCSEASACEELEPPWRTNAPLVLAMSVINKFKNILKL